MLAGERRASCSGKGPWSQLLASGDTARMRMSGETHRKGMRHGSREKNSTPKDGLAEGDEVLTGVEEWALITNQPTEGTAIQGTEAETRGLGWSYGTYDGALRKRRFRPSIFSARFQQEAGTVLVRGALLTLSKLQGSEVAVASWGEGSTRWGGGRETGTHTLLPQQLPSPRLAPTGGYDGFSMS